MSVTSRFKVWLVGIFGSTLLRAINASLRWENLGGVSKPDFWDNHPGGIFAFWHSRLLLMSFIKTDFNKKSPIYVLASEHSDGRMISEVIGRLGLRSIAGSSSHGGSRAILALLKHLTHGAHAGVTPDGPRGPAYRSKKGAIYLASRSGVPIYPCTYSAERCWKFKSWDKMILPKPFSRAVRIMGDPIHVPPDITNEQVKEYQELLDKTLNEMTDTVDRYYE